MDFTNEQDFMDQCGYVVENTWYPRVTKIVSIKAKPALYRFYAKMPDFNSAERMKEQSAEEGTLVHETIEKFLLGENPVIHPAIGAAFTAFHKFLTDNTIEINQDFVEYRLHHKEHRYAGTNDAIAEIGGKVGVLDIKTSQAIYRDYNLQTAAYIEALKPIVPELETRWILRIDQDQTCEACGAVLRKKGGHTVIRNAVGYLGRSCSHQWGLMEGRIELKEFPNWKHDFEAFLGAKKLWEWEHADWLEKIGYLPTASKTLNS